MARLTALLCCLLLGVTGAVADVATVRIARQWGLAWMPFALMEREKMIEARAAAAGLGEVKVEWITFSGGGPMNDALISGSLDYASTGIPGFLVLWDKARGGLAVKAVSGFGSVPFALLTRNPAVKTLGDFSDKDRIALPTVKISGQALMLQIAAERAFGAGQHARLDALTVSRSNPDGTAALLSPQSEINSHFSSPPYQQIALKSPDVHVVMTTKDIFDTPFSNGLFYATQKFHDANPKLNAAVNAALQQAIDAINSDRRKAAADYLDITKEKLSLDQLMEALSDPLVEFSRAPHHVFDIATFMQRTGTIKGKPAAWHELFFEEARSLDGS